MPDSSRQDGRGRVAESPGLARGCVGEFDSPEVLADLRGRSVRGGVVVLAGQGGKTAVGLVGTVVLARLLTPTDFGWLAMVTALTGFLSLVKDVGLPVATVQRPRLTGGELTAVFWVNLWLGVGATLVTLGLSPVVGWFYGESRLIGITAALSLMMVLSGFGVQQRALLRRQMRFGRLVAGELAGQVCGVVVAIVAALGGAGYWALVLLPVVMAGVSSAVFWGASTWRPGWRWRWSDVRPFFGFGTRFTGHAALQQGVLSVNHVLVGRVLGARPVGLYSKAYQLFALPTTQLMLSVSTVAVSGLSRLQDDAVRFRSYYVRALELLLTCGMPIVVVTFVCAETVIEVLLGSQWLGSVPVYRALAPSAFFGVSGVATNWVYVSLGRTDRQLRWQYLPSVLLPAAYVVGLGWGILGVAVGHSVVVCGLLFPGLWYCYRGTPVRMGDFWAASWRPGLSSLVAGVGLYALLAVLPDVVWDVSRLGMQLGLYGMLYVLVWCMLPGGRGRLGEVWGMWRG